MGKNEHERGVHVSDLVGVAPPAWPKKAESWEDLVEGEEIVYEDAAVVAFHDSEDEDHESPRDAGEMRITILPKQFVHSLMDLSVADAGISAAMLHAIQQVALKLGLQAKGFEVRSHILPPYQHRPGLALKIRAGKPPKKAAAPATSSPPTGATK